MAKYCKYCGAEIKMGRCCNGQDCGCMGLPTDPDICCAEYEKDLIKAYKERAKGNLIKGR